MSVSKLFVGLSAAAALLLCSCSQPQEVRAATAKPDNQRKAAPDFKLKDAEGQSVSLSDYRGKVVLLNFWATWCGPCALEIPWFEEFEQQYKSRGFEVVGVSMDDDGWSAVKPYIAAHKINYRVLLGDDTVGQLYGGLDALPTTFILDREGRIAFPPHVGLIDKNDYLSEIQELLGPKQNSVSLRNGHSPVAALFLRPAEQAHR